MNHKKFWSKVLRELKEGQPKHAYSTWFAPIKSIGLNNGKLLLELPNQFFMTGFKRTTLILLKKQLLIKMVKI